MKCLLLLCFPILAATTILAQDQSGAQKAWMDYMTPGKVHQMLAHSDGTWDYEMTFWMAPGAPPSKSTGTTENKMILGGRYQESVHKGNIDGMEFEGHGLLAYDNAKKIFQNSWVDNMGTGIMLLQGTWNDDTHKLTLAGKSYDPMQGKDIDMKEIFTIQDDDHHMVEMYYTKDGKDIKSMEIHLTRKK
ncbi:DUF1579 domain-containing protein [[Flexibacter] sp. ATCC 35208]|uniref:DUF1579 domain-containing protein n=1 Tax=[Flexibacter] sp. ATCC 35208 TaxID=1936242 RepID=UPI0009CD9232|nr:DUF1579 domain-containing protein [[Flexibacter] sp. ATCC 35208]OMP80517.1 hypothetical protein BW716_03120 [[Flexibacter] sp. ATCC 35208]